MLSWKELKERRLVQIVASYAVAGWVILSIFGEVIDRGVLPEILYRVLLVLYLGGFVAATVTGWFHGEKGNQKVTRPEVILLTIVGLFTLAASVQTVRGHMAEQAMRAAGLESGIPLNHLAVLYFQDRTRGEDLTYLADGLTETLIDRLSRTQTLTVLTQNASALYRDSDLPFDVIAGELEVGTIVDGTVERRGMTYGSPSPLWTGLAGGRSKAKPSSGRRKTFSPSRTRSRRRWPSSWDDGFRRWWR